MKLPKIAIGQINARMGDIEKNGQKIISFIEKAKMENVDLIAFPELSITGYPPKDLLLRRDFLEKNKKIVEEIIPYTRDIGVILGFVDFKKRKSFKGLNLYDLSARYMKERILYNAAIYINNGKIEGVQYKIFLPNYDVFDEKRYFESGKDIHIFKINGLKFGITICEDIWVENGPTKHLRKKGAELLINISASPFYARKSMLRRELLSKITEELKIPAVYVNLVGGQDDLVFDGGSLVYNKGKLIDMAPRFKEILYITELKDKKPSIEEGIDEVYNAIVLGLRDYAKKNGFKHVILGLSGGIDSALVAAIAVDALGRENVKGVIMPGPYSPEESEEDAKQVALNLGIESILIPISEIYLKYLELLGIKRDEVKITEQNIQARIRGNILMGLSNEYGALVLITSNKSELAMGYSTLYGDTAGGFAPLSDVPKTLVYQLARYYNKKQGREIIPEKIITKTPSAELAPGQKDEDDLPPYPILDRIIHLYVEEEYSKQEIIEKGFEKEVVDWVIRKINQSEYKRKQVPLGVKITPKAFGFGRRVPITNFYDI